MALNDSSREDTLISKRAGWYKVHTREDTLVEAQMCNQWDERPALPGLGDAGSVGLRTCLLSMSTADPQKARGCTGP